MVRRLLILVISAFCFALALALGGAFFTKPCDSFDTDARFDVAVVLGAGMDPSGRLHLSTLGRIKAGAHLYRSGIAAALHMTGGRSAPDGPAAGDQMAIAAQNLGLGDAVITRENASQSTLQNALFSKSMLEGKERIILVSEGFHLYRSYLSFAWAGLRPDALCHSTRLRQPGPNSNRNAATMLVREALAVWFNAGRAGVWSVATLFGFEGPELDAILQ